MGYRFASPAFSEAGLALAFVLVTDRLYSSPLRVASSNS